MERGGVKINLSFVVYITIDEIFFDKPGPQSKAVRPLWCCVYLINS